MTSYSEYLTVSRIFQVDKTNFERTGGHMNIVFLTRKMSLKCCTSILTKIKNYFSFGLWNYRLLESVWTEFWLVSVLKKGEVGQFFFFFFFSFHWSLKLPTLFWGFHLLWLMDYSEKYVGKIYLSEIAPVDGVFISFLSFTLRMRVIKLHFAP